jgi:hypothetical protein
LTPRRHQSGTSTDYEGHVSRQGDVNMRGVLCEAASDRTRALDEPDDRGDDGGDCQQCEKDGAFRTGGVPLGPPVAGGGVAQTAVPCPHCQSRRTEHRILRLTRSSAAAWSYYAARSAINSAI